MSSSRAFSSLPSPRRPASPDIWLAYAQKCSPGSLASPFAASCSVPAQECSSGSRRRSSFKALSSALDAQLAVNREKIDLVRLELNKLRRNVDREFPEVNSGSRLPRARPSQTGSQVKPSFTRKFFPNVPKCLQ